MIRKKYSNNSHSLTRTSKSPRLTRLATLGVAATLFILAFTIRGSAQEANTDRLAAVPSEWLRMREGLRQAKPIPEPKDVRRSESLTPSGDLVGVDMTTRQVNRFPAAKVDAQRSLTVREEPGSPGAYPTPADGNARVIVGDEDPSANKAVVPLITPTPPHPIHQPYLAQSYRTHFKLLMRFPVPNFKDKFFVCSATSGASYHLLTAGHCLYNHDPLGDGTGRGAGYAAEIWAWPSHTDDIDPVGIPDTWEDFPWGVAKATKSFTYDGWINNADWNWDFGFITLDRRIGDRVGWMARRVGIQFPETTLYYSGYPIEEPYVPHDTPYQYPGGNLGNVIGYTPTRIKLSAYTYGGHSGGAVYSCCSGSDYIFQGVNSTSNRQGYAEATAYTLQMISDFKTIRDTDAIQRPPANRAQLIEYVFDNYSKGLGVLSVSPGDPFDFVINAFNAGYAPSGPVTADIYLTKTYEVFDGKYVGSVQLGNLDANKHTVQYKTLGLPTFVPPGNYFVGWSLRGTNPQYNTDNTAALITKRQLVVVGLSKVSTNLISVIGGTSAIGIVDLTSGAPQQGLGNGTDVLVSSSTPAAKPTVSSVHFNEGEPTAIFTINTTPVAQDTTAIITANLNGITRTTSFLIKRSTSSATLNSLALQTAVLGGNSATATVSLTAPAPANGITVNLTSSSAKAVVPAVVKVNAGLTSATFTVTTSAVTTPVQTSIKATYGGIIKTAPLTISPVQPKTVTLSPSMLKGGASSVATITINGVAPPGGANISLTSSSVHAKLPTSVRVNAGSSSVTVTVKTTAVTANTTATIKAAASGMSKLASLTIQP